MRSIKAYFRDVARMSKLISDGTSLARYATDRLLVMLLDRIWVFGRDREREIHLRGKISIRYRLNRGDMQGIREVWLEQVYKLPSDGQRRVLVDLGANIGLTSLWLTRRYNCEKIVAIEPVKSNAQLVRTNYDANAIPGTVIEAAAGPRDGMAKFEESAASNLGHIGANGCEVRMICMASLLHDLLPDDRVDLLKIDIEGGEEALLKTADISWLSRIQEIIVEFHPTKVDYPALVSVLTKAGFEYFPSGSRFAHSMDYFRRR